MKILHIWNTAGVASIIARTMDRIYKTDSWVLMKKDWDKWGLTTYGELLEYRHNTVYDKAKFTLTCLRKGKPFDIIHVHGLWKILPTVKLLYPSKPLIFHCHGTDIRGLWKKRRKFWKYADQVLYSTLDLKDAETPIGAVLINNPIDTDLFYRKHLGLLGYAFHISYNADNEARALAEQYKLKLVIHNSLKNPIRHIKMVDELCKYEYYIDVKAIAPSFKIYNYLSKTGLEALACGLKVVNRDGEILRGLPDKHNPVKVAGKLYQIYRELMEAS